MASKKSKPHFLYGFLLALLSVLIVGSVIGSKNLTASLSESFNPSSSEEASSADEAANFKQEIKDEKENLKNRTRECKDINREIKNIKKQFPNDVKTLETQIKDFCTAVEEAKVCVKKIRNRDDLDTCRSDIIQDRINDVTPDIWDGISALNNKLNAFREIKNQRNTCKNINRETKNLAREAKRNKVSAEKLVTFNTWSAEEYKTCQENYAALVKAAEADDYDTTEDILASYFHANTFWEDLQDYRDSLLACANINQKVPEINRDLKETKRFISSWKQEGYDTSALTEIWNRANAIFQELKNVQSSGQCDQESAENYLSQFEQIEMEFKETVIGMKDEKEANDKDYEDDNSDQDFEKEDF